MSRRIAVLGGGLSGLSAAFHLSRRFPDALIRVFEQSDRVGGWVSSERVEVQNERGDSASMLLEHGPRTIKPSAISILELTQLLGLRSSVIAVPESSEASKNKFVYLPQTGRIEALPTSISSAIMGPFRSIGFPGFPMELFKKSNRPKGVEDESLHDFVQRRFGDKIANTLASAVMHGIYAADARKLSVRAVFPSGWGIEDAGDGSLIWGMPRYQGPSVEIDGELAEMYTLLHKMAVFSYKNGLGSLTEGLRDNLAQNPNVSVHLNTTVTSIDDTRLTLSGSTDKEFDATHVVSSIPLPKLESVLGQGALPHLTANSASSVTVFNFVFPVPPSELHPPGFGYLVPRPTDGYESSSTGMLGVTFDSCTLSMQDSPGAINNFTKLTVMAGGPFPRVANTDDVLEELRQHFGLKEMPKPVLTRVHHLKDCIPTPHVGHVERLKELKDAVSEKWGGRFELMGAGASGVSVGNCVDAAKAVGQNW
ncbi:Protoporphyrinogen oxidase [Cylindrobasidium torrendii FP15055 ss-10]|uniref:Protoporphyrinogen oxidase n=1 Tax=Cylindrobasidium torrendii FP15055 ss-10 TaxID=1314674 RepID=A0A0D7BBF5_9AGAR|nr:Protoporphyrinogen oxidase [Cylindrobasidium torrendii FP15055 ss-10]